jgi:hypothetical protein
LKANDLLLVVLNQKGQRGSNGKGKEDQMNRNALTFSKVQAYNFPLPYLGRHYTIIKPFAERSQGEGFSFTKPSTPYPIE